MSTVTMHVALKGSLSKKPLLCSSAVAFANACQQRSALLSTSW